MLPLITVRPVQPPRYQNAAVTLETFERWFIANHFELCRYWAELSRFAEAPSTRDDFLCWTRCQYDLARIGVRR